MKKGTINQAITFIIGSRQNFSLEHRYLNATNIFVAWASHTSCIINMWLGLSWGVILSTFLCGSVCLFLFWLSRVKRKYYPALWITFFLFTIVLNSHWFTNGGLDGPTAISIVAFLTLSLVLLEKLNRIFVTTLIFVNISVMMWVEYYFPDWVTYYDSREARFIDYNATFLIFGLLIATVIIYVKAYYKKQKQETDETLRQLRFELEERRRVEESLRESEEKYRNLMTVLPDMAFIIHDLRIIYFNEQVMLLSSYTDQELSGKAITSMIIPEDREIIRRICSGETAVKGSVETMMLVKNGKTIPVYIRTEQIVYNQQKAYYMIASDISERKEIQRRIFSAIIETEEKERSRFAGDLHDGLGPLLSSIRLCVNAAWEERDRDISKAREMMRYTNEMIDEAIVNIRDIANNLMPNVLGDYGLNYALEAFFTKINASGRIPVNYESDLGKLRFDATIELVIFRSVAELVNNSIRHARAGMINVRIFRQIDFLVTEYRDNGIGFNMNEPASKSSKGIGLANMVSRLKSLNGTIHFETSAGHGFYARLEIPLHP